jgi:4-phytase/acid phosphatase
MTRKPLILACLLSFIAPILTAQTLSMLPKPEDAELRYVVYLTRHGVRSPTGKPAQYNAYSAALWPAWDVPPGYLTAHGYKLMEHFGAYDRMEVASQGLLPASGCENADRVTFYADSDQRTRETGKALAAGFFPGCAVPVQGLPEGVGNPLFHPITASAARGDLSLTTAAIAGRIGGNPSGLTEAYRTQLTTLDDLLATCGATASTPKSRTSLFDISASLSDGKEDHLPQLRGPLNTAATLTENLLLEYTQGLDAANVGWGCVDGAKLRSLIDLHTAAADFTRRTPAIARMQRANLLGQIRISLEQAATGKPVPGAVGKPSDRVLFLVGHDTNLTNIAGALNLTWIADGRRDDTPPGGALVFELWKNRKSEEYSIRMYFTVQTLEQMRSGSELTLTNPPQRVPVFLPGCSRTDLSCTWPDFEMTVHGAIDPPHVKSR